MDLKQVIESLVAEKQFISWRDAAQLVLGHSARPSDYSTIVAEFNKVLAGSDALLVDQGGKYSYRAPVEKHFAFLKANGYERMPEVKEKTEKVASVVPLFRIQPVKKVSETEKQLASTQAELQTLKEQMAVLLTSKRRRKA